MLENSDPYCEAVIKAYNELSEEDRLNGMLIVMNKINEMNLLSKETE